MGQGLKAGPIGPRAVHVCLDMQRLFAPGGPWPAAWAPRIMPVLADLARHVPHRTVFTRFIPPPNPQSVPGQWRALYRKWRELTGEKIDPGLLDLVSELAVFAPPAHVVDKARYSAFSAPALRPLLAGLRADTLIFSGAETDVCVLASALDAVDLGFRTIIARDAVCSSSDPGHDAVLSLLTLRLSVQVELADVDEILSSWDRIAAV